MKTTLVLSFAAAIALMGCKKTENALVITPTQSTIVTSSGSLDGFIVNSNPKTIKLSDKTLDMGWTGGAATRAFVSFDLTAILPASNQTLVIESVDLTVYESNTNMLPFSGEGVTRVVSTYLLDYGTLDSTDFNRSFITDCGVITNTGYNVLNDYVLSVTQPVTDYLNRNTTASNVQFRLQFSNNENVPMSSTLSSAQWRVYSGEDQGTLYNTYRPTLSLKYHYKSK